ncbi:DUF4269 domain-containing protein [Flavobacterium sp. '19STA2R22 D10 B1']|uniref:DUF4269 domain-containing protein n=1 Tax=Flavobacterium aerium TaxID=3037261 RepID=UPI00278C7025|nr:DUF4269 domain-containing protein [Flavobacterium sp. '19STA2R22 D10 B1']
MSLNSNPGLIENIDFTKIGYLNTGNEKQKKAYRLLQKNQILSKLSSFDPVLVGTIPINIDIDSSDLDIICYYKNKADFIQTIFESFGQENQFQYSEITIANKEVVVANFFMDGFEMELFGQDIPTLEQNGYKHMVIEHQILMEKGETFRQQIVDLKEKGYKTEPAFGLLLGLHTDPYTQLLDYYS